MILASKDPTKRTTEDAAESPLGVFHDIGATNEYLLNVFETERDAEDVQEEKLKNETEESLGDEAANFGIEEWLG